jgi:hypothetical protein
MPFSVNRVRFTHDGSSNFAVWAYDDSGERDLLVNTIGPYDGWRPIFNDGVYFFEITADGNWGMVIEAVPFDPLFNGSYQGIGDAVSPLFLPSGPDVVPFVFTNTGESNFAVWLVCGDGSDLLQNEIGPVTNEAVVRWGEPPCVWEVESDGSWSLAPK